MTGDRMDVQIAEWAAMIDGGSHADVVNAARQALATAASERDRADKAEAERARYAQLVGIASENSWISGKRSTERLIGVLWKSRRMWQERALEAEGSARLAQANARWQLGHVQRLEAARAEQAAETLTDGLKAMLGSAYAEAKLTAVLARIAGSGTSMAADIRSIIDGTA